MNTEATQESNEAQTTGERLRIAREQLGLSQQTVAERLCLKVTTVRDIEENTSPQDLASTFLRGYIRSYARLVHIPEEELLPMMAKQTPVRDGKVEAMHSYSLGKRRKKRDGWLMGFTWIILLAVLGLTGAWWWQNHKAQQAELITMDDQSSSGSTDADQEHIVALTNTDSSDNSVSLSGAETSPEAAPSQSASGAESGPAATPGQQQTTASQPAQPEAAPSDTPASNTPASLPTANAEVAATSGAATDALTMTFSSDCWLEVADAAGKKLFSGLKRKGESLDLAGHSSYKLKIGAPAAVQIQFQGKPVDLSRFVRTNQVARLTVSAE